MGHRQYEITEVPPDAADQFEAMGTKPKFWFNDNELQRCLFKQARPATGEDWAEKVASELAGLLGLPHAHFELATWRGIRGVVSPSFIERGQILIHGNELLFILDSDYPAPQGGSPRFYRVTEHTLDAVYSALAGVSASRQITALPGVESGFDVFVGYLMFDAWIGNTDRHHENWGIIADMHADEKMGVWPLHVAPTFDHASSLGRELADEERRERLRTKDRNRTVAAYADKARSALYNNRGDAKPLTISEAFRKAAERRPDAGRTWLKQLEHLSDESIVAILHRVPAERLTPPAREFAAAVLDRNRQRLLDMAEHIG